jgi:pimeloyl-ACP methyl ester carboxylesterase
MAKGENWIEVGPLTWFYREAAPVGDSDRVPVLLLHGLISQSYSWREVMPALAEQGYRVIAPDWLGFGFSGQPDRLDFPYTPEVLLTALAAFIDALGLARVALVTQGFLGTVGIQYALRYPDRVDRLAIFNAPLTQTAKLPWKIRQFGIPLLGDALTQDPLLVDRILEGGGGYRVEDKDMDVYRRPWLRSSDVGRALQATVQQMNLKEVTAEIETGLRTWPKPLLIGWGLRDPWLPLEMAQACVKAAPDADLVELEEVGHYPQEDWHEKVIGALVPFLKRMSHRPTTD